MTGETYSHPIDPLVEKNLFRARPPALDPIPRFSEIQSHLPVPVLPEHPEWVTLYWYAWERVWTHLLQPQPQSGFIASFVDPAFNNHLFMFDTAIMALLGVYGRHCFDFMGGLNNFYARQHDDGFICREINIKSGHDFFFPFDPNSSGPNILAWTEWQYFRQTGDIERLQAVFWPLAAYHTWFRRHRTWPNGLYWATRLSSGLDNQPRIPNSGLHHQHWSWVDASMQAALSCGVLGQMATLLEEKNLAVTLKQEQTALIESINAQLWNEADHFYQDLSPNGQFSRVKSIAAYWGLLVDDLIPANQRDPFVNHLREPWAFKVHHRIPSQSADSEGYNADSGNYYRGAVWPAYNYMVLRGLRHIKQHILAHEISVNHLGHVTAVFQETGQIWENYAPESTSPGNPARRDFVGMSGITPIALLIEDVIGITADWPLRRVRWDRRLATKEPYGVKNFPYGPAGRFDLIADEETLVLTTDVPFTLTIRDAAQSLQTAVPAGTTKIALT